MMNRFYLVTLVLVTSISCVRDKTINVEKKLDTLNVTHRINFIDNRGVALLNLDSTFNDCYSYLAGGCIDYVDHCIKPKSLCKLRRGFVWSELGDTLHHLILTYLPFDHDSLNQKEVDPSRIHYYNKEPYLIKMDSTTYKTINNTYVSFVSITAIGKIRVTLLTNQIPYKKVEEYFKNIMENAIIRYQFKPLHTHNLYTAISLTDSINRKNNCR